MKCNFVSNLCCPYLQLYKILLQKYIYVFKLHRPVAWKHWEREESKIIAGRKVNIKLADQLKILNISIIKTCYDTCSCSHLETRR
jgi:hypothetical protein